MEDHSRILNVANAKVLASDGLLFPKADNEEENHNSFDLPGYLHSWRVVLP